MKKIQVFDISMPDEKTRIIVIRKEVDRKLYQIESY